MVATDVVVYLGSLRSLFAAAGKAARSGGFFALSTEDFRPTRGAPAPASSRAAAKDPPGGEDGCVREYVRNHIITALALNGT